MRHVAELLNLRIDWPKGSGLLHRGNVIVNHLKLRG